MSVSSLETTCLIEGVGGMEYVSGPDGDMTACAEGFHELKINSDLVLIS